MKVIVKSDSSPMNTDESKQCRLIMITILMYIINTLTIHSATYMHEFERPKNLPIAGRCEEGGATRQLKLKMKIYFV